MKETDFLEAMGRVDKRFIEESVCYKRTDVIVMHARYAACFALLLASVFMVTQLVKPELIGGEGVSTGGAKTSKHSGDVTVSAVTENDNRGGLNQNYSGNTSMMDGIKKDMLGVAGELLEMTVGEIESLYGGIEERYSEQGPRRPVYSVNDIPGLHLVFHNWDFKTPVEKDMKPSEIILNNDVRSAVFGLAVGDDIANNSDFIKQSGASMYWNYTGVYVEVVTSEYKVTYMMEVSVIFNHNTGKTVSEKEYLENPRGEILVIRVAALEK